MVHADCRQTEAAEARSLPQQVPAVTGMAGGDMLVSHAGRHTCGEPGVPPVQQSHSSVLHIVQDGCQGPVRKGPSSSPPVQHPGQVVACKQPLGIRLSAAETAVVRRAGPAWDGSCSHSQSAQGRPCTVLLRVRTR